MTMHDTPTPLLQTQTGAFSLVASILLVLGLGCIALQVMGLVDGINPDKQLLVQFVPGIVGGLLMVLCILQLRKKGELVVWTDRITGKRPSGLTFDIALASVAAVELKERAVVLKDAQGQLLLLQRTLAKDDGGIIWLLKEYGGWQAAIWQAYPAAEAAWPKATRHFLGDDGEVSFGDIGFLVDVAGQMWFFPESPTVDVRGLGNGQLRMNQRSRSAADTLLQFQPQPGLLPLARFCTALFAAQLPADALQTCLETLADNHGGTPVRPASDSEALEGTCLGYPVQVWPA